MKTEDYEGYRDSLPPDAQVIADEVRKAILTAAPKAVLTIKYGMPAVVCSDRCFIYFAVWKNHVGLYPIYPQPPALEAEIGAFRAKKDTVQFSRTEPLPVDLITRLARSLVAGL